MNLNPRVNAWLRKIVIIVLAVEVAYVVLLNSALQLPLTQTLVNKIRPEKFHVSWENAWTWYPSRVHVRGVSANGNSRSQVWQFDADSVSGSISLLPLILRRVWVNDVEAVNLDYRQRPRLKPDRDYSDVSAFFPEIEGREVTPAITSPRKKKRPWLISVEDIRVSGSHSYWIYQFQGSTVGEIRADLTYKSRGGPLSMDVRQLDLEMGAHYVNADQEVFRKGAVRGRLGFAPFMPRENKGISLLNYLSLNLDVDLDSNSLAFINVFTLNYSQLNVSGTGRVHGHLHFDQGWVREGTDLDIDASNLAVRIMAHRIEGDGTVGLKFGPETNGLLDLGFRYRGLRVIHDDDTEPLLTGRDLSLTVGGDGKVIPDPDQLNESRSLSLDIDGLTVPDLSRFQRYLPQKWPFRLYGGQGHLRGFARMTPSALSVDLAIESERADMGVSQYRFDTNLDTRLKLDNPSIMNSSTSVAGSHFRLSEARLKKGEFEDTDAWGASLEIDRGYFSLFGESQKKDQDNFIDLFQLLGDSQARQLLGNSTAMVNFKAHVSSLAWVGVLLGGQYQTGVAGSSTISGDFLLEDGMPAIGTNVEILSNELAVSILDYRSSGDGRITFSVDEGGEAPDWSLFIGLNDADLKRSSEATAAIRNVTLLLDAVIEDMSLEDRERRFAVKFRIPSARVTDMSTFNNLLPPDAPLQLTGGTADLTADIVLQHNDADGWVRLYSDDMKALADQQSVSIDLDAEILLAGGVPAGMEFDISGSEIRLTDARVTGESRQFDEEGWSAVLKLLRGETTWLDPPRIDAEAKIRMSDSRPIVAVFSNQDGFRPEFLSNMLTVEDIEGSATLQMNDDRIIIPYAHAISDNIEVGAKAVITEASRDGVIYFRYKKADALLRVSGGKKNLDIINVRKKYDEYEANP